VVVQGRDRDRVQDPDREDAHEWEVQKETAQMYDEMGQGVGYEDAVGAG